MRRYLDAFGHVFGAAGALVQAAGGILCLVGNDLITDDASQAEGDSHPQGDTYATAELDGRTEPAELHRERRGQSIDDDDGGAYRLGFNNDHQRR